MVLPGSKATVADLAWLRERGLADGSGRARRARAGAVLGICGGFQMLCRRIDDPVESGRGRVDGLGLLDADIVFAPDKTLRHWDAPLHGYEIHHGQVARNAEDDWLGVGIRRGHGLRHALARTARQRRRPAALAHRRRAAAGRAASSSPTTSTSPARRDAQLD